jgi:pimeloyl-ACP methyl ester carboxylesterase
MNHSKSRRARWLAAAGCIAAFAALPGSAGAAESPDTSTIHGQTVTWADDCPPPPPGYPQGGMQCARLKVPLDYSAPYGRQIEISISRIKAENPSLRRGVLFTNPGGPGGAGLYLPQVLHVVMPQSVRDRYDLIGIDPRGVGTSTPVSCGLTAQQATRALVPLMEPGGFDATVSWVHQVADGCTRVSGDLLPFMTTANTARDLDQIRGALGEQKISYFAWSYGTYLGAVYSSLYPDRTDVVVLDSAINPNWVWREQFRSWGLAGDPQNANPRIQPRFDDYAVYAAARDASLHYGATKAAVRSTYFALLAQVTAHPVVVGGSLIDGPMFREFTFSYIYSDGGLPGLADFWALVRDGGDGTTVPAASVAPKTGAASRFPDVPVDNSAASALAITCGDVKWSRSVETYRSELAADQASMPMFGELGSNIWPCAFWPAMRYEPLVRYSPVGPRNVLVVQNLRDPATPYAGAVATRQQLGRRSSLTTVDQGGHGVFLLSTNTCGNQTVTDYLVTGTLPADKSCAADPAPAGAALTDDARESAGADLIRRSQLPFGG